jgi:hypothetical protein
MIHVGDADYAARMPVSESRWSVAGEDVFCPAATATGDRTVALFTRSASGELLVRECASGSLGEIRSLGVPAARVEGSRVLVPVEWPIAACSTRDGVVHLLARGVEGELLHGQLRGEEWSGFESIGIPVPPEHGAQYPMGLAGAPTACCRERGRLDVFGVNGDGDLLHTRWDGEGFSECESLGGMGMPGRDAPVFGAISAFDAGAKSMGVVARARSGDLVVKWWSGNQWRPFVALYGPDEVDPLDPDLELMRPLAGPPAACGGGSTRADVFVRGPRGGLYSATWNGERWSKLQSLGMPRGAQGSEPVPVTGGPVACAWSKYRLDVFVCATDGKLYRASTMADWSEAPGP